MAGATPIDCNRAEKVAECEMAKYVGAVTLVLLTLAVALVAKKDETLEQLIARANAANIDHQPDLFAEAAERELNAALDAFKGNRSDDLHSDLQQVVTFCDRAQTAAVQSKKHVKRTEIRIRQLSHRLRDLKPDVEPDDAPVVQSAIDKLEHFRAELLRSMFDLKDDDHD